MTIISSSYVVSLQVMVNYLIEIVEILYKTDVRSCIRNGKRIASAVTLLCCFHEIVSKVETIPSEHVVALLSMLRLLPDTQNQRCVDWEVVNELLPETIRRKAFDAVHSFIVYLSLKENLSEPAWIFALPIAHFLNGTSRPFQPIEYDPRVIPWGDKVIGLGYVRNLIKDKDFG